MKRVLIAGDCDVRSLSGRRSYQRALMKAGAIGAYAAADDEQQARMLEGAFDALLLPGGGDMPGGLFGQPMHIAASADDPARDLSDRLLFDAFRAAGKRVLGICRGCQAANVFLGGTLHQHLPDAYDPVLWHSGNITGRHDAQIDPGTPLAELIGAGNVRINSSHHQAIDKPGKGLTVCATAPDGVIEAACGEGVVLVQWHPEQMGDEMLPLFRWIAGELDA